MLIPIHLSGNDWTLSVVKFDTKTIDYYDSYHRGSYNFTISNVCMDDITFKKIYITPGSTAQLTVSIMHKMNSLVLFILCSQRIIQFLCDRHEDRRGTVLPHSAWTTNHMRVIII